MSRKLVIQDIADLRAYERERDEFRRRIIALKKVRRVAVGPFVSLLFENRDTIRFQIQEMARAEKIISDDGVQTELDIYNPLIPEPGSLAVTLFIELTSKSDLVEWLPKLVGIEHSVELWLGDPAGRTIVAARPDPSHERQLTREAITPSVHYVHFDLRDGEIERFRRGPVTVAVAHQNYSYAAELDEAGRKALLTDLNR